MSRLATSFVLGYHGCELAIAQQAVAGTISIRHSDQPFDWLGPGAYFWESDPERALEWARHRQREGAYGQAAVVGAIIDLGNCLNLLEREGQQLLYAAYLSLKDLYAKAKKPLPENRNSTRGGDFDRRMRLLDCAVIRHLHELIADLEDEGVTAYDTVRGMFTEGSEIYPGSAFHEQSHVQIAVRNREAIKGVFFPPEFTPSLA